MLTVLSHLVKDKSGVAAIEYGLLAALIGVAVISVIGTVGTSLNSTVASNLGDGQTGTPLPLCIACRGRAVRDLGKKFRKRLASSGIVCVTAK